MELTKEEKKKLKGLAHHLKPIAIAGKEGLSQSFIKSVGDALTSRELIKVKYLEGSGIDRKVDSARFAGMVNAELISIIGNTVVLYKYNENSKKHVLDDE